MRISNHALLSITWIGLSCIVLYFSFSQTIASLHEKWIKWDQSYSHGYFILAISLYWIIKNVLSEKTKIQPNYWIVPIAILVSLIWYFGHSTQMLIIEQLALPLIFTSLLLALYGLKSAPSFYLPILCLYIAMPAWDVFQPILREATVHVVQIWLTWLQIPAHVQGFLIELPYGTLKVAGSCAGMNYFMMGLVIGILSAAQNTRSFMKGVVYTGLALLLAIIANWVRVYSLVLIGYYSKMQSSIVYEHGTFGWIIFAVVLTIYFFTLPSLHKYLDRFFPEPLEKRIHADETKSDFVKPSSFIKVSFAPIIVSSIFLTAGNSIVSVDNASEKGSHSNNFTFFKWHQISEPQVEIDYSNWDNALYLENKNNDRLNAAVYSYYVQKQGKEMIYYSNKIAEEDDLTEIQNLTIDNERQISIVGVKKGYQSYLVAWTYKIGNHFTISPFKGKFYQFIEGLRANSSAELIVVTYRCNSEECISDKGGNLDKDFLEKSALDFINDYVRNSK